MKISINIICFQRILELCNTLYTMLTHTDLKYLNVEYKINILIQDTDVSDYYLKILKAFGAEIFESKKNLGVAGGRNFLIDQNKECDLFFFFDDDLIFHNFQFKAAINQMSQFDLLNFQVYRSEGWLRSNEIPRPKHDIGKDKVTKIHECLYVIGAAHCIKNSVIRSMGTLSLELSGYGMEEIEFSLRAICKGFKIGNMDQFNAVKHLKSSSGRVNSAANLKTLTRRRLAITRTYLGTVSYFKVNLKWFIGSIRSGWPIMFAKRLNITVTLAEKRTLIKKINELGGWL